jgi:hypothetical protein
MQRDKHFPRNDPASLGSIVHDAAAGANLALAMLPKAITPPWPASRPPMAYTPAVSPPSLR